MNNIKIAKQLVKLAKDLISENEQTNSIKANDYKNIGNQFKSLSRQIVKPNNNKNISKGLNDLSKSFSKMPKANEQIEDIEIEFEQPQPEFDIDEQSEGNMDIAISLKKIAEELLKDGEE